MVESADGTCCVHKVLYDAPVEGGSHKSRPARDMEMLVAGGVHPLIGGHREAGHLAEKVNQELRYITVQHRTLAEGK